MPRFVRSWSTPRGLARQGHDMAWPPGDFNTPAFDDQSWPPPIQDAMHALKDAIMRYRSSHGRDPIRNGPMGHWLDAIDSGRSELHPDDQRSAVYAYMERISPAARQQIVDTVADWEREQQEKA